MATSTQQPMWAPSRGAIQAMIADFDSVRRRAVRSLLVAEHGYDVIAETDSVHECRQILTDITPELLICTAPFVCEQTVASRPFPLYITIGPAAVSAERLICALDENISHDAIADALSTATVRILTTKAGELSSLIRHYVQHRDPLRDDPKIFAEREGRFVELFPRDILWIKASGNYVRVYTGNGEYHQRESIRSVASRLEPCGFLRIHRGAVVNRHAIRFRVLENESPVAVVLENGTRVQVGPNFRDRISQAVPTISSTVVS
jgi:two-component system LytT family response regulator